MARELYRHVLSEPWKSLSNYYVEQARSGLTLLESNHLESQDTAKKTKQLDERHPVCSAEERLRGMGMMHSRGEADSAGYY